MVVEHRLDLFRYARAFTRNDADAEDLAQTAVLRALASGTELREPDKAKAYLFRIVRNLATDQARARSRVSVELRAVLPDLAAPDVELEAVFLRAELRTLPKGVIEALPRAHQQILHLRFIEELDHAAIAVRMNTTEQAARQRLYRALQALRALCAEYDLDVP